MQNCKPEFAARAVMFTQTAQQRYVCVHTIKHGNCYSNSQHFPRSNFNAPCSLPC